MGAKQSTNGRSRAFSNSGENPITGPVVTSNGARMPVAGTSTGAEQSRSRTRSLGHVQPETNGHPYNLSQAVNRGTVLQGSANVSPDRPSVSRRITFHPGRFMQAQSLPVQLFPFSSGIKCPVCSKFIQPDEIECHLVMCLTKPRLHYNEDVLVEDKGECVICLEDLTQGDTIARLPCLCIYHKTCIDQWFQKNRSCPEHPND